MEAEVALGPVSAKLDLATKDDFDKYFNQLDRLTKYLRRPYFYTETVEGNAGSPADSGPVWADCGTPPTGKMWGLQWVTVFALSNVWQPTAIANAVYAVYVGSKSPSQLVLPPAAIPGVQSFPDKVVIKPGQHVWVGLQGSGLLAGSAAGYAANVGIIVANQDDPGAINEL